jgi:hypothetical protein
MALAPSVPSPHIVRRATALNFRCLEMASLSLHHWFPWKLGKEAGEGKIRKVVLVP